jgi:hypothetical protein
MGYYFDWLEKKWLPKQRAQPTSRQMLQRARHRAMLRGLITEIEEGDGVTRLYASLLARCIVSGDETLMRELGQQVAEMQVEH